MYSGLLKKGHNTSLTNINTTNLSFIGINIVNLYSNYRKFKNNFIVLQHKNYLMDVWMCGRKWMRLKKKHVPKNINKSLIKIFYCFF